jgi:hypothetical protein
MLAWNELTCSYADLESNWLKKFETDRACAPRPSIFLLQPEIRGGEHAKRLAIIFLFIIK